MTSLHDILYECICKDMERKLMCLANTFANANEQIQNF